MVKRRVCILQQSLLIFPGSHFSRFQMVSAVRTPKFGGSKQEPGYFWREVK